MFLRKGCGQKCVKESTKEIFKTSHPYLTKELFLAQNDYSLSLGNAPLESLLLVRIKLGWKVVISSSEVLADSYRSH